MTDLIGKNLGQYLVEEQIAVGGMATVYKALQPSLDRYVAIKVLHSYFAQQPGFTERFDREAKAVAKLAHPHILPVYDYGTERGLPYLVTQYVEAGTLDSILTHPVDLHQTVDILEQISQALQCAHDMGIVHRDIKPSNVLMDHGQWVLLTDFGLAKMIGVTGSLSTTGIGIGTPTYMAPEQGQGLSVDHRADIYSLGVILFEMTTGIPPFYADNAVAVVVKHVTEPLVLPRVVNPDIPPAVERVILRAMAKEPDDRYGSAMELAQALRQAVEATQEPGDGSPAVSPDLLPSVAERQCAVSVSPPSAPAPKSSRRTAKALAGIVLLLVLLSLIPILSRGRKDLASQLAADESASATTLPAQDSSSTAPQSPVSSPVPTASPQAKAAEQPAGATIPEDRALTFAQNNPPMFEDDFSDPNSGWPRETDRQASRDYEDGAYVIRVPSVIGQRNQVNVPLPIQREMTDFVLELDLAIDSGTVAAGGSVGFRESETKSVFAGLSAAPCSAFIGEYRSGEEVVLDESPSCNWQTDAHSRLTLVATGHSVTLLINGEERAAAETQIVSPGGLSLLVTNTRGEEVVLRVESVRLWDLGSMASNVTD